MTFGTLSGAGAGSRDDKPAGSSTSTGAGTGLGGAMAAAASTLAGAAHKVTGLGSGSDAQKGSVGTEVKEQPLEKSRLVNRAGESQSPYVRGHMNNPVAWQLWGDEAIELAKKENKLLFVSIGYSACHWCHVMERESFENDDVAEILNNEFIPIKIDREERPDIDRIYMNFVQATTGSGGWPLNVFVTPTLEPVFGGTYWPGPASSTPSLALEDQLDFLDILKKLSTVWHEQEDRCREDSAQILERLKEFAAEGMFGGKLGEGGATDSDGLDLEILEEAYQHFASTYDKKHAGFGAAPKFPTPTKLSFLLRLPNYPQAVIDVVGADECAHAQQMALSTLKAMARGGIRDHISHGFARYSVTPDWSLPHFEKMLYDNAQLLHIYLDGFLASQDPELLGVVYDLADYLTIDRLAAPRGGFFSSEDADSFYRKGDAEKREGAFYVWTKREVYELLPKLDAEIVCAFFGIKENGNVAPGNDPHDEFINQNVLSIRATPKGLADKLGIKEAEVVRVLKEGRRTLRSHRDRERGLPGLDDKVVCGWNGIALGALARTAAALMPFDDARARKYLEAAKQAAGFVRREMYNETSMTLKRVWRDGVVGDTDAFADDYAFVIEGLLDLYGATFEVEWLRWADELQHTQLTLFYDTGDNGGGGGGFFSTPLHAPNTILRLKDGMDNAEPSTNGVSCSNLFRLSALLADDLAPKITVADVKRGERKETEVGTMGYERRAKETLHAFEAEMMQYPWGFGSFLGGVVAARLGVSSSIIVSPPDPSPSPLPLPPASPSSSYPSSSPFPSLSSPSPKSADFSRQHQPRGGLTAVLKVQEGMEGLDWLRERNLLVRDLRLPPKETPKEGEGEGERVYVCEGGVCRLVAGGDASASASASAAASAGGAGGSGHGRGELHTEGVEKVA